MITPAISVLGAVEGLAVATPQLPAVGRARSSSSVILVALFMFQRRGTARVGAVFGPVMVVWFAADRRCWASHGILRASGGAGRRRTRGMRSLSSSRDGLRGFLVLGAVVLVVTGGEALYADMGHFGKRPIRLAWFAVVLPALVLNYFGQGALLLDRPGGGRATRSTRWCRAGRCTRWSRVATAAAVVASQALISGAFSLTRQAVQLGYCPRVTIRHTSQTEIGQIYLPGRQPAAGRRLRRCWC